MFLKLSVLLFVGLLAPEYASAITSTKDHFTEELLLKPLYSDQIYAHFHFSTVWNTDLDKETCKLLTITQ